MTADIVERLRERAASYRTCGPSAEHTAVMLEEAAAEIERLRAALREIMAMDEVAVVEWKKGDGWLHQRVARAALEEK